MEYEYRPVMRQVSGERPDFYKGEWHQISTNRGAGRAYLTASGARTVVSRQKRADEYERERTERWHPGREPYVYEYKIQRRPFGEWEDFE